MNENKHILNWFKKSERTGGNCIYKYKVAETNCRKSNSCR